MRSILVAICVLILGHPPVAAQNRLVAEIPLEFTNKTIIPVTLGGATLRLILDSGMDFDGALVFDADKVDQRQFNLVAARQPGVGAGSPASALYDSLGSFTCGPLRFDSTRVILLTSSTLKGFPNDGAVGYSLLGHYAVELDYDANVMRVYEPDSFRPAKGWTSVGIFFQPRSRIPWLKIGVVTVDEAPVTLSAYIDYAARETLELLDDTTNRYVRPKTGERKVLGTGASGDLVGYEGRVAKLMIGPFTLEDQSATVVPASVRSRQTPRPDAVLGNGAFRGFNVIFDYAHQTIWLRRRRAT